MAYSKLHIRKRPFLRPYLIDFGRNGRHEKRQDGGHAPERRADGHHEGRTPRTGYKVRKAYRRRGTDGWTDGRRKETAVPMPRKP